MEKTCCECGKIFIAKTANQKWCQNPCLSYHAKRKQMTPAERWINTNPVKRNAGTSNEVA